MPATGLWGFLSFLVLIVVAALAAGHLPSVTSGSWFGRSPVVSLVCTGGELTTSDGSAEATDRNPGLSMTLHLDTHLVQVHVTGNQPIEAQITETEDDIHFNSETISGDVNRLTGMSNVEVKDTEHKRQYKFANLECAKRSQRF